MSSRLIARFRSYCPVCSNYRILRRFVTGEYFCASCTHRLIRGLHRLDIDCDMHSPDLAAIRSAVGPLVETMQQACADAEKRTRWQDESQVKRWRRAPSSA